MKRKSPYFITALLFAAILCLISCTREEALGTQNEKATFAMVGDPVEVHLNIAVGNLSFGVATRAEEPVSDYDGEDTEEERHIDDIWIFEYDASSGDLVNTPERIEITDQSELEDVPATLANNNGSPVVIYVVANSGSGVSEDSAGWVVEETVGTEISYPGFMTIDDLEANVIPTPHPQRMTWDETKKTYVLDTQDAAAVSIPMGGYSDSVTAGDNSMITVPVSRMFAKLLVRVDLSDFNTDEYNSAWLNTVTVGNIPEYCTVGTLWDGDRGDTATPANYSACGRWISRTFNAVGESSSDPAIETGGDDDAVYPYLIYVPENIQGENGSSTDKADNVPNSYALTVTAGIYVVTSDGGTQGEYSSYIAYPGGNETTNFNVRRNCLYRVTLRINDLIDDILPSANCIVCLSGETTSFYPYCREEVGGGYDFTDYLDAYGDESKKISYVKIIWQSTNGGNTVNYSDTATGYIGDNSYNEYVWIDDLTKGEATDEYHRRIHVTIPAGRTGNALIGAYNSTGEIVWSWHIWSRAAANDPRTVNTKLYYTYDWDNDGIYGKDSGRPRVAGYTIMNCNLGAMQDNISSGGPLYLSNVLQTFGTLYQWGRKDPFPPIRVFTNNTTSSNAIDTYDESQTGNYFDNENKAVTIVNTNEPSALFHSVEGSARKGFSDMIPLTIQNPTVFYAGTKELNMKSADYIAFTNSNRETNFYNNYPEPCDGNWILDSESDHFNRLWGGLDPEKDTEQITKWCDTGLVDALNNSVHIYDDYGEKSIFDPCPYGWRVSPPDLWLGFTSTGLNPIESMSEINYNDAWQYSGQYGLTMYMTAWREGETSFFPTQGVRAPDGCSLKAGTCGNYNNATADLNDRVNILHIHNSINDFKIFEIRYIPYYIKSSANSLRCVRIDSVQQ